MKKITKEILIQGCNIALKSLYNSEPILINGLTIWFSQERGNCEKPVWRSREYYANLFGIAYLLNEGEFNLFGREIFSDMFDDFINKESIVELLCSKSDLIIDDVLLLLKASYPWSENFVAGCFHPARLTAA